MRGLTALVVIAATACGDNAHRVELIALVSTPDPLQPGDVTAWSRGGEDVIATDVLDFRWSTDRERVAITAREGAVSVWSFADERSTPIPDVLGYNIYWSPDGSRFIAAHRDGGWALVEPDGGPTVRLPPADYWDWTIAGNLVDAQRTRWCDRDGQGCRDIPAGCALSRDDQQVACLTDGGVEVWRFSGAALGSWGLPGELSFAAASASRSWSSDGSRLAVMRRTSTADEIWIGRPDAAPEQVASVPVGVLFTTWSPDDRHLAVAGPELTWLVSVDDGVLGEYPSDLSSEFSSDGTLFALADATTSRLVHVSDGRVDALPGSSSVWFSPLGNYLVLDETICNVETLACREQTLHHQAAGYIDGDTKLVLWGLSGAAHPRLLELVAPDGTGHRHPMFDGRAVQSFEVR
jgi:hypothetical protein